MNRALILIALAVVAIAAAIQAQNPSENIREAVRNGDVDRVKALLDSGVDANATCEDRFTPIFFATDPKVVDLLITHGAKLESRDRGQTPIESAAERYFRDENGRENWKAIISKLRAAGAEYTIDTAIYMNDIAFVKSRLDKDASWVNKLKAAQSVPLRVAARTGRTEICKLLLEHKADPDDFEQGNGYPILFDAIDHPDVVKLLIKHKANLKRRITWLGINVGLSIVGDEATALHYAVSVGNLESVRLLIAAGLDPSAADNEGQTPLHIAIKFEGLERSESRRNQAQFVEIIKYLLKNDASLRLADKSGETPLELAKTVGSPKEILSLLRK